MRNRESAMKVLRARLYALELERRQEELDKIESGKKKIEWGSQIRSYILHPYNMVHDHRLGLKTSDTQGVLDGDIEIFVRGFLRSELNKK